MIPILTEARWRTLAPGQVARLLAIDVVTGARRIVAESRELVLEAPNWSPDGSFLVVNAGGLLYRVSSTGGGTPTLIPTPGLDDHNNDHLISRDGRTIYTSSETSGHLFAVPVEGGEPRRISPDRRGVFGYFLQGESPDGTQLAFTGAERRDGRDFVSGLFVLTLADQSVVRLGDWSDDSVGCEWSPDGEWLFFSSELLSTEPGHTQIFRMPATGGAPERLTHDDRVNWFPKVAPDGSRLVYLSFPPGTVGHETDVDVILRSLALDGSEGLDVARFVGGQGTLNVNSWAPDSRHVACVEYPLDPDDPAASGSATGSSRDTAVDLTVEEP